MHKEIKIKTSKHNEFIDITSKIEDIVDKSGVKEGICVIYVPHATAGLTINENADPNLPDDIVKALAKAIPEHDDYQHDKIDNNAAAHIKSTIVGVSKIIPISKGELTLGTWQDIFLCDFDGPRTRKIIIKIIKQE